MNHFYIVRHRFKKSNIYWFISFMTVTAFFYSFIHIENTKYVNYKHKLHEKESVLCLILTSEASFIRRSVTVWNTWAHKCHKALFVCNCRNLTRKLYLNSSKSLFKNQVDYRVALRLPIWQLEIKDESKNMGEKVFQILKGAYDNYTKEFKWFLLTDDDTFIFVDNLYKFIVNKSASEPLTYGYNINRYVPSGFQSGGAGILFTNESLKRITLNIRKGICNQSKGYGDVALGRCQYMSNVTLGNSLDEKGRERFHPFKFRDHYKNNLPEWLHNFSSNGVRTGDNCCSDETISFHYNSVDEMHFFENLKNQENINSLFKVTL